MREPVDVTVILSSLHLSHAHTHTSMIYCVYYNNTLCVGYGASTTGLTPLETCVHKKDNLIFRVCS